MTSKKTIYIEATALSRTKPTGVDFWVEGIIQELINKMSNVDFVFFRFAGDGDKLRLSGKNVREVIITKMRPRVFRLLLLLGLAPTVERLLGVAEVETIIFPNFYRWPVRTKSASIYTFIADTAFHDLAATVPNVYFRALLEKNAHTAVRKNDMIVTCSEYSASRIKDIYSADTDNLLVLYPGFEKRRAEKTNMQGIPKQFLLFVGTLEPRKNIANLIKGYVEVKASLRRQYPLLLAGGKGWLDDEIQELLRAHKDDKVYALGYVDDATKMYLYSKAAALVYPVAYEGFGMPVIEAQAFGVPVMSSDTTSLPEAAGQAALFVKLDAQSITEGITKIIEDETLRKRLSSAGKEHAKLFTWQNSAKKLAQVIRAQKTT